MNDAIQRFLPDADSRAVRHLAVWHQSLFRRMDLDHSYEVFLKESLPLLYFRHFEITYDSLYVSQIRREIFPAYLERECSYSSDKKETDQFFDFFSKRDLLCYYNPLEETLDEYLIFLFKFYQNREQELANGIHLIKFREDFQNLLKRRKRLMVPRSGWEVELQPPGMRSHPLESSVTCFSEKASSVEICFRTIYWMESLMKRTRRFLGWRGDLWSFFRDYVEEDGDWDGLSRRYELSEVWLKYAIQEVKRLFLICWLGSSAVSEEFRQGRKLATLLLKKGERDDPAFLSQLNSEFFWKTSRELLSL